MPSSPALSGSPVLFSTSGPSPRWKAETHAPPSRLRDRFLTQTPRARGKRVTDRLLTADEVAELLAVPVRWVRDHTRSGLIPCVHLGHYRRYRREAVAAWLDH